MSDLTSIIAEIQAITAKFHLSSTPHADQKHQNTKSKSSLFQILALLEKNLTVEESLPHTLQPILEDSLLQKLVPLCDSRALRASITKNLILAYKKGSTNTLFKVFLDILDKLPENPNLNSILLSLHVIHGLTDEFHIQLAQYVPDVVSTLLKLYKKADGAVRESILILFKTILLTNLPPERLAVAEVIKLLNKAINDRLDIVRSRVGPVCVSIITLCKGRMQDCLDLVIPICFKGITDSSETVRKSAAEALGNVCFTQFSYIALEKSNKTNTENSAKTNKKVEKRMSIIANSFVALTKKSLYEITDLKSIFSILSKCMNECAFNDRVSYGNLTHFVLSVESLTAISSALIHFLKRFSCTLNTSENAQQIVAEILAAVVELFTQTELRVEVMYTRDDVQRVLTEIHSIFIGNVLIKGIFNHSSQLVQEIVTMELLIMSTSKSRRILPSPIMLGFLSYLETSFSSFGAEILLKIKDKALEALFVLLSSDNIDIRIFCARVLQQLAVGVPEITCTLIRMLHSVLQLQISEIEEIPHSQIGSLNEFLTYCCFHGHVQGIVYILHVVKDLKFGLPQSLIEVVFVTAKRILALYQSRLLSAPTPEALNGLYTLSECGWKLIDGLLCLDIFWAKNNLKCLYRLWSSFLVVQQSEDKDGTMDALKAMSSVYALNALERFIPLFSEIGNESIFYPLQGFFTSSVRYFIGLLDGKAVSEQSEALYTCANEFLLHLVRAFLAFPMKVYGNFSPKQSLRLLRICIGELTRKTCFKTQKLTELLTSQYSLIAENPPITDYFPTNGLSVDYSPYLLRKNSRSHSNISQRRTYSMTTTQSTQWVPNETLALNECIALFSRVFPLQSEKIRISILQHFLSVLSQIETQTDSDAKSRDASIAYVHSHAIHNICAILLHSLTAIVKNSVFPEESEELLLFERISFRLLRLRDVEIMQGAAQCIGLLCRVQSAEYVASVFSKIKKRLSGASADTAVMSSLTYTLGAMHSSRIKALPYVSYTVSVLMTLSKSSSRLIRANVLRALRAVIDSNSLSFTISKSSIMGILLLQIVMNVTKYSRKPSQLSSRGAIDVEIGKLMNSILDSYGPEVFEDATLTFYCLAVLDLLLDTSDNSELNADSYVENVRIIQHFLLWKFADLHSDTVAKFMEYLFMIRDPLSVVFTSAECVISAVHCLRNCSQVQMELYVSYNIDCALVEVMNAQVRILVLEQVFEAVLSLVSIYGKTLPCRWLYITYCLVVDQVLPEMSDRGSEESENVQFVRDYTRICGMYAFHALVALLQENSQLYGFDYAKAKECTETNMLRNDKSAASEQQCVLFILYIREMVKLVCRVASSSEPKQQSLGLLCLEHVLELFSDVKDPIQREFVILQPFAAEISTVVNFALSEDSNPMIKEVLCCKVLLRCFKGQLVVDKGMVNRILTSLISIFDSPPDWNEIYDTFAISRVQVFHINALAQLLMYSKTKTKSVSRKVLSSCFTTEKGEFVIHLMRKFLVDYMSLLRYENSLSLECDGHFYPKDKVQFVASAFYASFPFVLEAASVCGTDPIECLALSCHFLSGVLNIGVRGCMSIRSINERGESVTGVDGGVLGVGEVCLRVIGSGLKGGKWNGEMLSVVLYLVEKTLKEGLYVETGKFLLEGLDIYAWLLQETCDVLERNRAAADKELETTSFGSAFSQTADSFEGDERWDESMEGTEEVNGVDAADSSLPDEINDVSLYDSSNTVAPENVSAENEVKGSGNILIVETEQSSGGESDFPVLVSGEVGHQYSDEEELSHISGEDGRDREEVMEDQREDAKLQHSDAGDEDADETRIFDNEAHASAPVESFDESSDKEASASVEHFESEERTVSGSASENEVTHRIDENSSVSASEEKFEEKEIETAEGSGKQPVAVGIESNDNAGNDEIDAVTCAPVVLVDLVTGIDTLLTLCDIAIEASHFFLERTPNYSVKIISSATDFLSQIIAYVPLTESNAYKNILLCHHKILKELISMSETVLFAKITVFFGKLIDRTETNEERTLIRQQIQSVAALLLKSYAWKTPHTLTV